ncbi:carbohydrate ABC transporter substrate-binding protein (CUT1 family) [Microcella putealis]|uniref:Carbohydrate ABC transporter substrate-binding protein (CUT1 family) n=1 Tax=Microcella putealis TaxID=337005 RepID=A0A4Q7LN69_9MICO|nr:maltose ABC transporter substrate-binding protein [Microcella putealis]RZS55138.1 carbohydrate ABC transporter substrate-binding protein (CUT1 family) [Microcella putealis]TQM23600.1 carbohydrate ABC transporter substrate-binding protein (CUT1 family) [Microcella putealis]
MKVTRSLLATGAMAASAALLLGACAGEAETADPTTAPETPAASSTLTVWVDADRAGVLEDIAAQFEADRGVAVELVTKDFGAIRDDFITQAPTGNGPDVIVGAHDWLGKLVQNGVVAPLELGDTAGDFQDVAITAMSYEGQTYGLPYSVENIAMVRNTDLVAEAPATFDELIAAGQAAGTEYAFLVGLDPAASDPYHLYPLQASFGAPVFEITADGTYDPTTLALGNEGGEQFATKLAEWGSQGILNTNISGDIAREEFIAGKSPFFLTGPWNIPAIQEGGINYAIDPIPTAGGETASPFVGVQGFFVSSRSENTIAATEFLVNYIGSEEVQTALYEVGGRAPALLSAFEAAQADADVAAFGAVGAEGVPMPNVPAMDVVWSDWGSSQVAIINGQGDPVELWRAMVASIQEKVTAG